jgi:hypothetical protein
MQESAMPVTVKWENDQKRVLRVTYLGRWTVQDAYGSRDQIRALVKEVNYEVDSIHDMRQGGFLPPSILTHTREIMSETVPQMRLIVLVGTNAFVQTMYNVFAKVYPRLVEKNNFRMVQTIEAAHELIQKQQSRGAAQS